MFCARTVALLALAALCGCTPTARLQVFRPAVYDLAGVESIAVLDFAAPAGGGEEARDAVVAHLAENRSYTLVEPAVLETVHSIRSADGRIDQGAALHAARQAGVDAILQAEAGWRPTMKAGAGPPDSITAELILVSSHEPAATVHVSRDGTQRSEGYDAARVRWANEVAQDLVTSIAPHYEPVEVALARQWWGDGKASVAAGNALARQGDWSAAEGKWEEARRTNPGNHAALHNLALVAESRQDYRGAFKLLDQALDQFPAKLYHQTRSAMESRQTTFLRAAQQVDAIRTAAARHAAPPGPLQR